MHDISIARLVRHIVTSPQSTSSSFSNITRLYRSEKPEFENGSKTMLEEKFPKLKYEDVAGLCKAATLKDIETKGWSLNPGHYVDVTGRPADEFNFYNRFEELNEELNTLNVEAHQLEDRI